jgi:hypothetical protein
MTCKVFYSSYYPSNCIGSGDACEMCKPIFTHPYLWLLGILSIGLILMIIAIILSKYSKENTHDY